MRTALLIPCYNEAGRLNCDEVVSFLKISQGVDLFFLNDHSSDNTQDLLESLALQFPERLFVKSNEVNLGKAETVRRAMLFALEYFDYNALGFWDADFSTPLAEVHWFYNFFDLNPSAKILFGCRFRRLGAEIKRKWYRQILGRVFATIVSQFIMLPVYDTQCGAKVFKREVVTTLFNEPFVSRWFFDVELVLRYRNLYGKQAVLDDFLEVPLRRWMHKDGSKLKFRDFLNTPYELFKIHRHYNC